MPCGKTHDNITIILVPIIFGVTYYFTNNLIDSSILLLFYLFSSFMFNGDLDVVSKPYNRWWILKFIWIPYQMMFKHRSVFTHGIIIGTIIRLIYLTPILFIITHFNQTNIYQIISLFETKDILITLIGLELGSVIHTTSDKIL